MNIKSFIVFVGARQAAPPFFLVAALVAAALPGAAQDIRVSVNGDPVAFAGQPPVQRLGTVLVPLRGVFEKLGANVQYDAATRTILAVKGPTTVSLRLGEAQALVNGEERALSLPAEATAGTTLVPLRFAFEALARRSGEAATRSVRITTDAQVGRSSPAPSGAGLGHRRSRASSRKPPSSTVRRRRGRREHAHPARAWTSTSAAGARRPATQAGLAALCSATR